MEFILGAIFGAGLALLCAGIASPKKHAELPVCETLPDESEQRIARQWENLLSYNGTKQYED